MKFYIRNWIQKSKGKLYINQSGKRTEKQRLRESKMHQKQGYRFFARDMRLEEGRRITLQTS